jgi:hypothetical protein
MTDAEHKVVRTYQLLVLCGIECRPIGSISILASHWPSPTDKGLEKNETSATRLNIIPGLRRPIFRSAVARISIGGIVTIGTGLGRIARADLIQRQAEAPRVRV